MRRYRFLRFPEGKPKAVTFSYDDGRRQDIRFVDVLNRHQIKGTFNVNSGLWGNDENNKRLCPAEIKKHVLDAGHEVAVHGYHHIAPGLVRPTVGIKDVLEDRLAMEKEFGIIIRGMAYPDTGITRFHNETTKEIVKTYLKDLGIVYARTLGGDNDKFDLPEDFLEWTPSVYHNNPQIFEYIDKFLGFDFEKMSAMRATPKLFYMWGHSYEFDNDDNWEHLEQICEKLAHKEDVWYATNIEIYEYIEAYHSLIFSADETIVYNPTLKTIWFVVDKKPYCIQPGETIEIS